MKKIIIIIPLVLLLTVISGCGFVIPIGIIDNHQKVEHTGEVPAELTDIIEKNLFDDITVQNGKIFRLDVLSANEEEGKREKKITMMDKYGKELVRYSYLSNSYDNIDYYLPTDDAGFVYADCYEGKDGEVSSLNVLRINKNGEKAFDSHIENAGIIRGITFIETNGRLYLFGTEYKYSEDDVFDGYSDSDVFTAMLDGDGNILKVKRYSGSSFDEINYAELSDNGFALHISSQSYDGDFLNDQKSDNYPVDYLIETDLDLNFKNMKKEENPPKFPSGIIGEKDGKDVALDDPMFDDFDAGDPTAYIDYGDYYMVVSYNITWVNDAAPLLTLDENYRSETVYSGYNKNGELIFRTSVEN